MAATDFLILCCVVVTCCWLMQSYSCDSEISHQFIQKLDTFLSDFKKFESSMQTIVDERHEAWKTLMTRLNILIKKMEMYEKKNDNDNQTKLL